MIKLKSSSKIYIVAHANIAAGGVESLHQLYYNLSILGYNAYMYYKPSNVADPVPDVYKKYDVKIARKIEDNADNVIIIPEILTFLLYRYKKIKKVIYWLSIDNYYEWLNVRDASWVRRLVKKLLGYNKFFLISDRSTHVANLHHIAQSRYAIEHLKSNRIEHVDYMPDYIHADFSSKPIKLNAVNRKNAIAYNPAKGIQFTKRIMDKVSNILWVPLTNMTPEEIADVLSVSKLYIDLGNHPGKDRIPREAALLGCCIITNKKGSAFYDEDLNIPHHFKFDENDIEGIVACIKNCINNYDSTIKEFEIYRKFILSHQTILALQISEVFYKGD